MSMKVPHCLVHGEEDALSVSQLAAAYFLSFFSPAVSHALIKLDKNAL
jgi:hypothetical protein